MDLYFELLEEFGEDEDLPETDDRSVFIDYLPTLRSIILRLMHKSRTEPSTKLIKQLKNELRAVMNETKMFSKHLSSKNKERDAAKLKEYLLYVNEMLETIAQNEDEIEQKLNELSSSKTSATEQLNLLCSSDDKSVIVLTEFFEGAEELRTFIDGDASRKSKSQVIYQCVLSLIIAHKKLGYMHKDFHPGNILVQKNGCTLKYVLDDNVIEFESEYIARIIDYGFSKVEYKGNTIKPIFTSERWNTQYEERQDEPDLKWMRHLISKLSPGTVNQFTVDLLNLETYDEMEEYILSNY
jgi:serine/threonine protein kinase